MESITPWPPNGALSESLSSDSVMILFNNETGLSSELPSHLLHQDLSSQSLLISNPANLTNLPNLTSDKPDLLNSNSSQSLDGITPLNALQLDPNSHLIPVYSSNLEDENKIMLENENLDSNFLFLKNNSQNLNMKSLLVNDIIITLPFIESKSLDFLNIQLKPKDLPASEQLPANDGESNEYIEERLKVFQNILVENTKKRKKREKADKVSSSELQYTCEFCNMQFKKSNQYYGHLHVHSGEQTWDCQKCKASFMTQYQLRRHERRYHEDYRPHVCSICSETFERLSQLEYHRRRIHENEKSFKCQICSKAFFKRSDLKTHINIHLKVNGCVCETCGRRFSHVSNLIRHKRIHTGIRPYLCRACGQRFSQVTTLNEHKFAYCRGANKPVDCSHCSGSYPPQLLRKHLLDAHGILEKKSKPVVEKRKYYCKICGDRFPFINALKKHENDEHSSEKSLSCSKCKKECGSLDLLLKHSCEKKTKNSCIKPLKKKSNLVSNKNLQSSKTVCGDKISSDSNTHKFDISNQTLNNDTVEDRNTTSKVNNVVEINQGDGQENSSRELCNDDNHCIKHDPSSNDVINHSNTDSSSGLNFQDNLMNGSSDKKVKNLVLLSGESSEIAIMNKKETHDLNNFKFPVSDPPENKVVGIPCSVASDSSSVPDAFLTSDEHGIPLMNGNCVLINLENRALSFNMDSNDKFICVNNRSDEAHKSFLSEQMHKDLSMSEILSAQNSNDVEFSAYNKNLLMTNDKNLPTLISLCDKFERNSGNNIFDSTDVSSENSLVKLDDTDTDSCIDYKTLLLSEVDSNHKSLILDCNGQQKLSDVLNNSFTCENLSNSFLRSVLMVENGSVLNQSILGEIQCESLNDASHLNFSNFDKFDPARTILLNKSSKTASCHDVESNKNENVFYLTDSNGILSEINDSETIGRKEGFNNSAENSKNQIFLQDSVGDLSRLEEASTRAQLSGCCQDFAVVDENARNDVNSEENLLLLNHFLVLHSKKNSKVKDDHVLFCSKCNKAFLKTKNLNDLTEPNGSDEQFQCDACHKKLVSEIALYVQPPENSHGNVSFNEAEYPGGMMPLLGEEIPKVKETPVYSCSQCNKTFSQLKNLNQHMGIHNASKCKHQCNICGQKFAWKTSYNRHMATHSNVEQPKFPCEMCDKTYSTITRVHEHVKRDHYNHRPHICKICAKCFYKKSDLKGHMRTHTQEKPYMCGTCARRFRHISHLIRHERIHSGIKPYQCTLCSVSFNQLGVLRNHLKAKHPDGKVNKS